MISLKFIFMAAFFALLSLFEYLSPLLNKKKSDTIKRKVKNLGLAGLNGILSFAIIVPLSLFTAELWDFRSDAIPAYIYLAFDIILLDLWIYGWHRANHEIPFLWRFHQVHHFDQKLDVTSALRFHFGEVFLSAIVRIFPIILFDIPFGHILIFESLILLASLFQHANIKLPHQIEQFLAKIIITPSIHFTHHHAVRTDTDSNYGTIFSFWDLLFSSRSWNLPTANMSIGIEGVKTDISFLALLKQPFLK